MAFSIVTPFDDEDCDSTKVLINLEKVELITEFEGFSGVNLQGTRFKVKESIQQVIDNAISFK